MFSVLAFTYLYGFKPDRLAIGKESLAALFSVANIYHWKASGDYWGLEAEHAPLLHTWSLSVEEQFYLFFPLFMVMILRFGKGLFTKLTVAAIFASFIAFAIGVQIKPIPTFYLLPTRAWELGIGCLLATLAAGRDKNVRLDATLSTSGLALILISYFFVSSIGISVLMGVLGAALVIAFGNQGVCNLLLSNSVVVAIGKLSYSLYLWHWPVILFATQMTEEVNKPLLIILIIVLSIVSYFAVEQRMRKKSSSLALIFTSYVFLVVFSAAIRTGDLTYATGKIPKPKYLAKFYDVRPDSVFFDPVPIQTADVPERNVSSDVYKHGGIIVGSDPKPSIVVIGDSHGVMFAEVIAHAAENLKQTVSLFSMNGQSPFIKLPIGDREVTRATMNKEVLECHAARIRYISQWKPKVVIVCARWSKIDANQTVDLLNFLKENCEHIVFIEQPPELPIGNRNALQFYLYKGLVPEPEKRQYVRMGNFESWQKGLKLVSELKNLYPSSQVIPVSDLYSQNSKALLFDGMQTVYFDDDHLTSYGGQIALHRIEETLSELIRD